MKAKKLTALFIGFIQLLTLLPLTTFAAEGDYKESLVAAGYFTPDGLVDLVNDGVQSDSVCGTGNGYDSTAKRYVGYVTNGSDYYSLRLPESRRNKLTTSAGYTLETYFSLGSVNDLSKPADAKSQGIIGAAQSGGFDFEMNKTNKLEVYVSNGGTWVKNGSNYPGSSLTLQANKWYHITVSVSPDNVSVYHDGALLESLNVSGYTLAFPTGDNMKDHYGLVIGGDYAPDNTSSNKKIQAVASSGSKFAFTNIYSKALTAEEVTAAYKENVTEHAASSMMDNLSTAIEQASMLLADNERSEELKSLRSEGVALVGKADLTASDVSAYVAKVNGEREKNGGFPLVYNPAYMNMPMGIAIADYAAKYGFSASGIWGMQKIANDDSKNLKSLRFSINTGSKLQAVDFFNLKFANDVVNVPVTNKDGYIYEIETTTVSKGADTIDMQFKGADSAGAEKVFARVRIERTGDTNDTSAAGNVYVIDKDGVAVGTKRAIKVSSKSNASVAGDLVYYKAKLNMIDKTISAWAVPRLTDGGTYSEIPANDDNLLIANFPFYDNTITDFAGVSHHAAVGSGTISSTTGNWITKIRVDEYNPNATYSVSGETDANVIAVTLNQNGEVKYNGEFNESHTTVTFPAVKSGTYDIAVTYANGYEAAFGTSTSVRVEETDVADLKITSSLIPLNLYTVSATTDKHVTKATLNQEGQVRFTGTFNDEHTAVTFERVPDGTYDVVTEYDMNYTAAESAAKTVTVSGSDIAASALAITSQAPTDGITLRVMVISDLQYGRAGDYRAKFRLAMDGVVAKAKVEGNPDVLMIPGDISHNSTDDNLQKFYEDLNSYLNNNQDVFANTKVLLLRGNHDAKDNTVIAGNEKAGGQFVASTRKYFDSEFEADSLTEVNGYSFIMVSQDTQRSNDETSNLPYLHSPATRQWLTEALAEAGKKNDRPIFIGMHPATYEKNEAGTITAANGTVFGSYPVAGSVRTSQYWATSELYDIIKPYSNAITFAGHSHWTVANEGSIHQRDFTSLNTGAVNNMEIEDGWSESFQPKRFNSSNENESNGFYITVNTDQQVNVERMDFYRMQRDNNINAVLGEDWTFNPLDKSTWTYTSDRDKVAPVFTQNAFVRLKEETLSESGCTIEWSNTELTENESDINHFKLEIFKKDGTAPVKTYTVSSYYWLRGENERPTVNNWTVSGLDAGTEYYAKLTAYDQFYNASAPIESAPFTTPQRIEKPAAVTEVSFTDKTAIDTSEYARFYGLQPISSGTVPVNFNSELKMYEGTFARTETGQADRSENFFKILLDEGRRKLMQSDGYTIDLMFSPTGQFQSNNNIIGAAEGTGFDIELGTDGKLHTYVRHDGGWVQSPHPGESVTTELGKYYHITVTYDGENIKVYQDGMLKDTRAMANKPLEFSSAVSADAFYGMVLGGDYTTVEGGQTDAQSAFNGKIVFANIYSGAWNSGEVADSHAGLTARKNLTKIDALNTMLTQTLPSSDSSSKEALLAEGWALMNSATLTDEQITAYLEKADAAECYHSVEFYAREVDKPYLADKFEDSDPLNAELAQYGLTADYNGTTWSVVKHNSVTSCYTDSLRFSLRNLGASLTDREIMKWSFADDGIHNPKGVHFDGEKVVFETETALLYNGAGYVDMKLNGKNAEGVESVIAKLRFKPNSANSKDGTVVLLDNNGQEISDKITVQLHDSNGHAVQVLYIRAEVDLENEKVSVWVVPRKNTANPYTGILPTSDSLLGENIDFYTSGVSELSSFSAAVTNNTATNGLWINNLRVSGLSKGEFTAAIKNTDEIFTSLLAGSSASVTVDISNPLNETKKITGYLAAYGTGDRVLYTQMVGTKEVSASKESIEANVQLPTELPKADIKALKLFVWDENLQSYAMYSAD